MRRYKVRALVEVGVCTGMSVVNIVQREVTRAAKLHARKGAVSIGLEAPRANSSAALDKYYMVDPWGERRCKPGCGCARHMHAMARAWPGVLTPLRGYSAAMAPSIPNASLDLAYIDAAHDYRNARRDVLAYWPKLRASGILAGHDFAHWRNWAEVRQDKLASRGPYRPTTKKGKGLPPSYGVAQMTQELFLGCHVHVRWSTWWVERSSCELQPLLTEAEVV